MLASLVIGDLYLKSSPVAVAQEYNAGIGAASADTSRPETMLSS